MIRFLPLLLLFFVACSGPNPPKAEPQHESSETPPPQDERPVILFFGDSITAGYGLTEEEAFPALIQRRIDSLGLSWKAVNAGLSGETSAGGLRRVGWLMRQPVDILVLELGGNDGLRGISPSETRGNLTAIIDSARTYHPEVVVILAGMQIPPNLGEAYANDFRNVFPEVAQTTGADLIPFILEGVGGVKSLNLPDGIHPTAEGHRILAETVWKVLEPKLSQP